MRHLNLDTVEITYDDDPEGYRAGRARIGRMLGAEQAGASVYELPAIVAAPMRGATFSRPWR